MLHRRSKKMTVAAVSCALVAWAGLAQAGQKLTRETRRVIDVDGQTRVQVSNTRGKIAVVGKGEGKVTVLVTKCVNARDAKRAERLLGQLDFTIETRGDVIVIETEHPERLTSPTGFWSWFKFGREYAYIDYAIELPREFSVEASTTSGDVRISDIRGAVDVGATSGDVVLRSVEGTAVVSITSGSLDVRDLGGDLRVSASSGDATVEGVEGHFIMRASSGSVVASRIGKGADVRLTSGDLQIDGCLGDLLFETSSGDARILGVEGGINALTSSGDLDVFILPVANNEFFLSSSSGDIGVAYRAPRDYGFLLDVSTSSGSIKGNLPIKVEKISRRHLKGRVGTGAAKLLIETASGDINIVEREEYELKERRAKKD